MFRQSEYRLLSLALSFAPSVRQSGPCLAYALRVP